MFVVITLITCVVIALGVFCIRFADIKEHFEYKKGKSEFLANNEKKYGEFKSRYYNRLEEYRLNGGFVQDCSYQKSYMVNDGKLYELSCLFPFDFYYTSSSRSVLDSLPEQSVDLDSIKYYKLIGSEHKEQIISGGGGGGSSLKGAIVGGIVAGEVGAVIGSRKKVEEIKTTYVDTDDRKCIVTLKNGTTKDYPYPIYEMLLDNIPSLEYDNYIENKKNVGKSQSE